VEGDDYLEQRLSEEEVTQLGDPHPPVAQRVAIMRSNPPCTNWESDPARELLGDFDKIASELEVYLLEEEVASD